jgi:excinuclease ABC subunit A
VGGQGIHQITAMSITAARQFLEQLSWVGVQREIAAPIISQIVRRLVFLEKVGAEYLTLDRPADTLSGGEMQRVRLATGIGSGLVGVCYLLDEPSIGLHARDNQRLIDALRELEQQGNTVVVVEHDAAMMRAADHLIDMGPGAGEQGGQVVAQGTPTEIGQDSRGITGQYLAGKRGIPLPTARRAVSQARAIQLLGATTNNLQNITVRIPLGVLVCVTGVSGSGKSSLVLETLAKAIARRLGQQGATPGPHRGLRGVRQIERMVEVDQSPIGRTPRSNPATYAGVFDEIRKIFARTKESRQQGFKAGRFSFNVRGGRCEACQGQGVQKLEMHFLPDMYATCPECNGARFNGQTLLVRYRDRSIADVLAMRVQEALDFFSSFPTIQRPLACLDEVGLGYITLGQPANTLSGGESQRIKLATELARSISGHAIYILDEPTTGLHFSDVSKLLDVLQRLVDVGNTVLVIEHHLDVIKQADWIIDLGPEGGYGGGRVVATGTPEEVAAMHDNHTGIYLREVLGSHTCLTRAAGEP